LSSIIDQIAAAEEQAGKIRQEAAAAARDMALSAQEQAEARRAAQAEAGRALVRDAVKDAELEGKQLSEQIIAQNAQQVQAQCEAAREKLPEAVSYLMRRVVNNE